MQAEAKVQAFLSQIHISTLVYRRIEQSLCDFSGVFDFMVRKTEPDADGRIVKKICCSLCGYSSKYLTHCKEHMLRKHAEPENIPCQLCGEIISFRPDMRRHLSKCRSTYKFKPC